MIISFLFFINSNYFLLDKVIIEGNELLSNEEVIISSALDKKENIFRIDLEKTSDNLMSMPQIQGVVLERSLPATIEVFVDERQPLGVIDEGSEYLLIDKEGWILAEFDHINEVDYPLLEGVEAKPDNNNLELSPDLEIVLDYLTGLEKKYLVEVKKIEIDSEREVVLYFLDSGRVKFGQPFEVEYKLEILNLILAEVDISSIDYINLSYHNNPVLRLK